MRIPNVLALLTSCLLLSANASADFDKGAAAPVDVGAIARGFETVTRISIALAAA